MSMHNDELLYINQKRIDILSSKEFFCGKKFLKYINLAKRLRFLRIIKELTHDTYAFFNKNVQFHEIMDFEKNTKSDFTEKVVVYTCIYGNYDRIREPLGCDPQCEYYLFTDMEIPESSIWKKADDSKMPIECDTPAKKNRYVKMFPYKFFDCKYSIYIDGNIQPVGCTSDLIQKDLDSFKIGIGMHLAPRENCIYEEAENVYHVGIISKSEMKQVISLYRDAGMPRHFGMFECNVIVRKHDNSNLPGLMEYWWECYLNGPKRDQLYFTYALYRQGFAFEDVMNFGASVNANKYFIREVHC